MGPIAEILVGQLPALHRIEEPAAEAAYLLLLSDMQEQLDETDARINQQALELVDLAVSASPFLFGREAFDALHQHAAIPGAVKGDDLPFARQPAPEALEIVASTLMLVRSGNRVDLEAARIERPAEAADEASLAGGIPSFEDDERTL